jgi:molecular chaperone IbpA
MTYKTYNIWKDLRPYSVGFDSLFNHFNLHLDHSKSAVNFPPYNIVEVDNFNWKIEMALAGFGKKDIEIEYSNNLLTVESVKDKDTKEVEENDGVVFKGISKRQFKKTFTLADDVVINGAELKDGMLVIDLEKIVPEEKKTRQIKIK